MSDMQTHKSHRRKHTSVFQSSQTAERVQSPHRVRLQFSLTHTPQKRKKKKLSWGQKELQTEEKCLMLSVHKCEIDLKIKSILKISF